MSRRYYTLLSRTDADTPGSFQWAIEFGDYDRETVEDERADLIESHGLKRRDTKIITTGDRQADIDAAVAALNGRDDHARLPH